MRKQALEVGKEYALWSGNGSYEAAKAWRGYSRFGYLTLVKRIRVEATDKRADVPAGPHTTETISVPVITIQKLDEKGKADGKQTYLRDGKDILSAYPEWVESTKHARAAFDKVEAERAKQKAEEKAVLDRCAASMKLTAQQHKDAYVRRDYVEDGKPITYSVTIRGFKAPAKRDRSKKAA